MTFNIFRSNEMHSVKLFRPIEMHRTNVFHPNEMHCIKLLRQKRNAFIAKF